MLSITRPETEISFDRAMLGFEVMACCTSALRHSLRLICDVAPGFYPERKTLNLDNVLWPL